MIVNIVHIGKRQSKKKSGEERLCLDKNMRQKKRKKIGWSGLIYLVFVLFFAVLIISRWSDVVRIFSSMKEANYFWLVAALGVQVLIVANQSMFYSDCYRFFGLRVGWWRFFQLVPAANFMSMVSPSGGFVAGISLLFWDGHKLNLPKGKLVLAHVVYWVVYYLVYLLFLLVGLFYLIIHQQLKDYVIIPALIMFAVVFVVLAVLVVSMDNFDRFKNTSLKVVEYINRFNRWLNRNNKIDIRLVKKYSYEIYDGYHLTITSIGRLKRILYRSVLQIFLNVLILMVLVWSLGGNGGSFAVLLSCYVVAALLMVVSVTPSGVGVVELAMITILRASLLDFDRAVLVVLLYRFFQFWLPLIWGFWAFRRINFINRK